MTYLIIALIFSIALIIIGKATYEPFDDIPILIEVIGFFVAIISACAIVVLLSGEVSCSKKVESQGYESRYDFITGCQLKDGNRWVDYDKWRYLGE